MKLSEINNLLIDYKTMLAIKQDAKNVILMDAADKGVLVDYSALENDTPSDFAETTDLSDFFNDKEIDL